MSPSHPKELIAKENEIIFSLPKVYFELQESLKDPDKTFQDLGEIISFDPALTARLLKIVNSAFYGFPSRIETISHAISITGMDQLTDLALATLVIYQFRSKERQENIYLSERELIGFDHADVGRELLKAWQLPPRLVEAVACHHQPHTARLFPVDAAIIHTSDYIGHIMHVGSDAEFSDPQLHPKSWEIIGLGPDDIEFMRDKVNQQYKSIVSLFFDRA